MASNSNHQRRPLRSIDLNVDFGANILPTPSNFYSSFGKENFTFDLNLVPNEEHSDIIDLNLDPPIEDELIPSPNIVEENHNILQEEIRAQQSNLSNQQRCAIYDALLERRMDGKLKQETTKIVASLFSVNIQTVQRIWKRGKDYVDGEMVDVSHRSTKNCGRKRVEIDINRVREVPLSQRTTTTSLATVLDSNISKVSRLLRSGVLRRHLNTIKPYLKEEHKKARLKFCISMLDQSSLVDDPKFTGMFNVVHIDEKWFYMTKKSETYYLLKDEEDPLRMCKSKNFIGKVMFLTAVARSRFDTQGNVTFSGKIGVFPFIIKELVRRNSVNRTVGTLKTKAITYVIRDIVKQEVVSELIPNILPRSGYNEFERSIPLHQDSSPIAQELLL